MIEQLFEFATNHFILVSIFFFLLFAFFVNEGKQGGAAVATSALVNLINKEDAIVVDVRDGKDYRQGHIAGAINIPYGSIDSRIKELEPHKEKPVVIVCKMGQHSGAVGKKLKAQGFDNVRRLSGGMAEWNGASLPVVKENKDKGEKGEKSEKGKGEKGKAKKGGKAQSADQSADQNADQNALQNKDAEQNNSAEKKADES